MGILSFFRRKKERTPAPKDQQRPGGERPAAATPETAAAPAIKDAAERRVSEVLIGPTITEKATLHQTRGWYTFHVRTRARKPDIRRAVERQYGVHVERVRVINVPGKVRRRGRTLGRIPGYRKALVTLRDGERIDLEAART